MKILEFFSISVKNVISILIGIELNMQIPLDSMSIYKMLIFIIYKIYLYFYVFFNFLNQ
jgi:hypothetical protein